MVKLVENTDVDLLDTVKQAISGETENRAKEILQEFVDKGMVYDYVVTEGCAAVKFSENEYFKVMCVE